MSQFFTEAAIAKSTLEKSILKHIQSCFTKKGMRDFKVGVKRRNYPKRSTVIKINQGQRDAVEAETHENSSNAETVSPETVLEKALDIESVEPQLDIENGCNDDEQSDNDFIDTGNTKETRFDSEKFFLDSDINIQSNIKNEITYTDYEMEDFSKSESQQEEGVSVAQPHDAIEEIKQKIAELEEIGKIKKRIAELERIAKLKKIAIV